MQINRLFEIIYILLEQESVTAKELAGRFEVSTRTIYRDIDTLSESGIPVYMNKGKGGGIALLPGFVLNKAVITELERKEILSSLYAIKSVNLEDTNTVLRRLGNLFGGVDADWIEVDFGFWSDGERETALFQNIKSAILRKREVHFLYTSTKGEAISRVVEPLKLVFKGVSWYLYGYCKKREDYRFFKLKRINELMVLEDTFTRKCPKDILSHEDSMDKTERIKVKLKIKNKAAYRVCDDFENYRRLSDGSYLVEGIFPNSEWFMYQLISYGEDCEVLEPIEFRMQIRDKLQSILKVY
ncbi:MAG: helix-turn-helix transcriptional regulator [Sedimentibacter sp.]